MVISPPYNASLKELLSGHLMPTLVALSISLATVAGYCYLRNVYSYWTKKGIKGPRPWPLAGHFFHFVTPFNRMKQEVAWVAKYGKVYGVYEGLNPRLVIADPEIMLQICVKDFEAFPNHELAEFSSKYSHMTLIKLKNGHWKRTRTLMTPAFTSGKMKRMFHFMDSCVEDLIECVAGKFVNDDDCAVIEVKNLYNYYTLDIISTCGFGLKLERLGSSNKKAVAMRDDFVAKAMKIFEVPILRTLLLVLMPASFTEMINFKVTADSQVDPFGNLVQRLVNQRRNDSTKTKYDDLMQSLIDARLGDKMEVNETDVDESHHVGQTSESILENQEQMISDIGANGGKEDSKFILTDDEIIANAMFLMAVGVETTSSLLAHSAYALAFYPEIQERLYGELRKIGEFDDRSGSFKFEYDALTSCKYLDAVLSETLRLMAPIVMLDRLSSRDYHLKKYDVHLPKGSHLYLAYYAILNDPDYWHEPKRFDPERFMPGNKEKIVPGSYCPFGIGPRHCIGMRFSLTESKLALAKMLMSYKFEPAPGTKFPPEPKIIFAVTGFKNLFVSFKRRSLDI